MTTIVLEKLTTKNSIQALLVTLNREMTVYDGTRIDGSFSKKISGLTYTQLHNEIKVALTPILEPLGLEYSTWMIRPIDGIFEDELLELDLNIKLDKGKNNHDRRGRILSLRFKLPAKISLNPYNESLHDTDSIARLIQYGKYVNYSMRVDQQMEYTKKLRADLEAAQDTMAELRTIRATLRNELQGL